ncbi:unnamed protein product [Kuraishia capsulata CBS 1993]|uniref:Zn(2)-C6 fungal-type domain-containing protein n=1 Tax=Kuraishia capsulata CBS 1993 TaxID=1382522 RepID=W6MKX7_9ASCO|nr:uncharacterized protein KUCA_T00001397001 [Kuraishia capsulata CBS 1993]CDK25427.1 unnamed protein product [Kuraishia capsulata CBS 1993]
MHDTTSRISKPAGVRVSQRAPQSCIPCFKRKVKCNRTVPCSNCVRRNEVQFCEREVVIVKKELSHALVQHHQQTQRGESDRLLPIQPEAGSRSRTPTAPGASNLQFSLGEYDMDSYNLSLNFLSSGYASLDPSIGKQDSNKPGVLDTLSSITMGSDWVSLPEAFTRLMSSIDYDTSKVLIEFACTQLTFIHNGIIPPVFIQEHEAFWRAEILTENIPKSYLVNPKGNQFYSRHYYYWISMYYGLLCSALYFGDGFLNDKVNLSEEYFKQFPRLLFQASLDCLQKAEFMSYPDFRAIQIFCIMSTCFHGFAGVHLHNCLLTSIFYVARFLKLDCLNDKDDSTNRTDADIELLKRAWWTLVIIEGLNDHCRWIPLSNEFSTSYPKLITINELIGKEKYDPKVQLTYQQRAKGYSYVLYQIFMAEMASIKKQHYHEDGSPGTLESLLVADEKMISLLSDYDSIFCKAVPESIPDNSTDIDVITFPFAKYLLKFSLNCESLEITRRLLPHLGRNKWVIVYRPRCINYSLNILRNFNDSKLPSFYNRIWTVAKHVINASLFILLDILMMGEKISHEDHRIVEIRKAIPVVDEMKNSHMPAKVGTAILEKLMWLVSYINYPSQMSSPDTVLEDMSIRTFLTDLKLLPLRFPPNGSKSKGKKSTSGPFLVRRTNNDYTNSPPVANESDSSPYFQTTPPPQPSVLFNTTNQLQRFDFNLPDVLNDSGWDELLHWISNGYFCLEPDEYRSPSI